jgi:ATP-dependent helicase Lhr and Lhr-like helicase
MEKIEYVEPSVGKDVKGILNPLVSEWFFSKFADFSLTQLYGVSRIHERKNILISAPTGGTKTLTAFLSILNYLVSLALKDELEDKVYAVYVSPLKALSNDIFKNLIEPLEEIREIAKKGGKAMQDIRVGLRTGDTSTTDKQKMLKKPVHILVTTPETLAIVMTTVKFVDLLRGVEFLVVDEVHALMNKRGVYMSLTLERLSELSVFEPVRIGLSATISPLEEIARFLVGVGRECLIADVKLVKKVEIDLDFPGDKILEAETWESQKELYKMLDKIVQKHKTTLIFTNTRAATERIVHYLEDHFPTYSGQIGAHHGSMSREQRFSIEESLRNGELKVVVTSSSLELGIDIGSIDYVILLKSPKGVARALQRIGRAGHQLHSNPKGEFIVMDRDDLVECGVLMKGMVEKKIDKAEIPKNALDVLAQQIYGMAIYKIWDVNEMLSVIRKSYCYSTLTKKDFFDVVSYLAGDYALEHRHVYAKIWYNEEEKKIGKKGMLARVIYMTNIGTIPSESYIGVVVSFPAERRGESVGKIDEGFLERMKKGDVFVLGGNKYQFLYTRGMKAYVKADISKNPTIPSWFSEMLPLSFDVALDIGRFRKLVKERIKKRAKCVEFIRGFLYCREEVAEEIYNYFLEQHKFSEIPDSGTLLVEKFKEEKEFLVFHTMYGRRVNDALSRAYAYAAARLRHRDIEVGISDNGFYIAGEKLDEGKILKWVTRKGLRKILQEAVEKTDVLKRRFRHCASRSLMILRNYKGREKSVGKQQVHSEFLYRAVMKISSEFPILREARREVMEDLMDVGSAELVLDWVESGKVKFKVVKTPIVSPFGLQLVMQGRTDLIKMEERAEFLKRMHELHLKVIGRK